MSFREQHAEIAEFRERYAPISERMKLSRESRARILASVRMEVTKQKQPRNRRDWQVAGSFVGVAAVLGVTAIAGADSLDRRAPKNPVHPATVLAMSPSQHDSRLVSGVAVSQSPKAAKISAEPCLPVSSGALSGIQMCTLNDGWQFEGNGVLLRTTDGGQSWNPVTPSLPSGAGMAVATALGPDTAWEAVATTGKSSTYITIYRTTNGGVQWNSATMTTKLPKALGGQIPQSITFLNSSNGWMTTRVVNTSTGATLPGALYHTSDGGQTWKLVATTVAAGTIGFQSTFFVSPAIGFTVASKQAQGVNAGVPNLATSELYRTTDGGSTWHLVHLPLGPRTGLTLYPPTFFQNGTAMLPVVTAAKGSQQTLELYQSTDTGASWQLVWNLQTGPLPSNPTLQFFNPKVGVMAWNGWFFSTADGWKHVQSHPLPLSQGNINWLHFSDLEHGSLRIEAADTGVGTVSLPYSTADGGASWHPILPKPSGTP